MQTNRLSILLGWFYVVCLVPISLILYKKEFNAQSGIIPFVFLFFLVCFFYASLTKWDSYSLNQYFIPFLLVGICSKVILSFVTPLWEDDWARYLWEGNLASERLSPYKYAPNFFFQEHKLFLPTERSEEILSRINHPDWTTIYFPLIILIFAGIAKLSPFSLVILKLSYLLLDLLILIMINDIRNRKIALLYFLFPLLFKEIYLNAHFEMICLFFLTLSIWLTHSKKFNLAILVMGLAIHSKIFLIILSPYFLVLYLNSEQRKQKKFTSLLKFFSISILGFLLPFIFLYLYLPSSESFNFKNLFLFAKNFEFNSTFFFIIKSLISTGAAYISMYSILVVFLAFSFYRSSIIFRRKKRASQWLFLYFTLFLLVAPLANPWYFLILIPPFFLSRDRIDPMWLMLVTPQFAYFTFTNLLIRSGSMEKFGFYNLPDYVIFAEIFAFMIIALANYRKYSILLYISSNISNLCKKA